MCRESSLCLQQYICWMFSSWTIRKLSVRSSFTSREHLLQDDSLQPHGNQWIYLDWDFHLMLNCIIMESVTCMAHGTTKHQLQAFNDYMPQQFGRCSNYLSMSFAVSTKGSSGNVVIKLSPSYQIHCRNAWASSRLRHSLRSGYQIVDSGSSFRAYKQCRQGFQQRQVNATSSLATQVGTGSENKVDAGDGRSGTGVVIIGAGLAGLAAARQCAREGVPFLLLEASDGVGGRVRTDMHQGFLLDRGFQIFISAYPEAMQVLDYRALKLQTFYAGALVWFNGSLHRVADPFRHFTDGVASLLNPIGTAADKVLVGVVRLRAALKPVSAILDSDETTILDRLKKEGFSESMVDRFFRPFFGGIFFDRELQTTSRLFEFVFKCLALGSNTLPADGIGAIPQQIAANLPPSSVLLNARAKELLEDEKGVVSGVLLENGRLIPAKHGVIIAAEGPEAARLIRGETCSNSICR